MYPGMTSVLNAMVGPALFAGRVKLVEQVRIGMTFEALEYAICMLSVTITCESVMRLLNNCVVAVCCLGDDVSACCALSDQGQLSLEAADARR